MANICIGFMYVRGYAPYVDEFLAIMQANYSYVNYDDNNSVLDPNNFSHTSHFFRIFNAYLADDPIYHSGVYKCVMIDFECAWSAYSCMFPGEHTYYNNFQTNYKNHFGTNILLESKRLQLEIEIWTEECGLCFKEHYKICSGVLVKDECHDYNCLSLNDYANYQEFINDSYNKNIPIDEEQFNNCIDSGGFYEYGMVDEEVDFLPEDKPLYLANIVMVKTVKE